MIVALFIRMMVATRLVTVATGGLVTLIEPDDLMISVISSLQPTDQKGRLRYVTADLVRAKNDMRLTFIHPQSTKRMVTELIETDAGAIIDLSDGLGSHIRDLLTGVTLDITGFFTKTPQLRATEAVIDSTISTALSSFLELSAVAPPRHANLDKLLIRSLNALVDQRPQPYMTVIDWRRNPLVELKIQPLKLDPFLSGSKTYVLVGLTGELGESLCRLMASHGARYFVVASR
jgi:hybrid polyketide synthase/nonribosomal peptide synthetase ACE1